MFINKMVIVTLYPNGLSLEGHSQNSKACKSLTVFFNLFVDLFESDIQLTSDFKKNYFRITTNNKKIIINMHKYIKSLSPIWGPNEIILINKT
jgi:hypothetical protein